MQNVKQLLFHFTTGTVVMNPNGPTFLPKESSFGVSAYKLGNLTRQVTAGAFDYVAAPG